MIFTISHDRNATNDLRGLEYGVGGVGIGELGMFPQISSEQEGNKAV